MHPKLFDPGEQDWHCKQGQKDRCHSADAGKRHRNHNVSPTTLRRDNGQQSQCGGGCGHETGPYATLARFHRAVMHIRNRLRRFGAEALRQIGRHYDTRVRCDALQVQTLLAPSAGIACTVASPV